MWRSLIILALGVFALGGLYRGEDAGTTHYVQLVRGTNSDQPPQAGSRHVGPKLAARFQNVFKWSNYWEICQHKVDVRPGGTTRVSLGNGREAEIDLTAPNKRKVTAFQNGRALDRTVAPVGEHMTLIGGERDQKSFWFIIVQRDKPTN